MSRWAMLRVLLLGVGLFSSGMLAGQADDSRPLDHEMARHLVQDGEILSLEHILGGEHRVQDGHILNVTLEKRDNMFVYEIDMVDGHGRGVRFEFDARTGQLLRDQEDN
ncbi:MAG: peptidase [Magnetococcales bacterium]|nr:peptidase [Magnetococcales bacterium]